MSFYRVWLEHRPDVGTFVPGRGAFRVSFCKPIRDPDNFAPVWGPMREREGARNEIAMTVAKQLRIGTFVNPTKLLNEFLAARRANHRS